MAPFFSLSCRYRDLATMIAREVQYSELISSDNTTDPSTESTKANDGSHPNGYRVGLESSKGYWLSLPPSTLRVVQWQLERWCGV